MRDNFGDSNTEIKTLGAVVAAGASVQVLPAVTGKKIRLMGYSAQTNSAANAQINIQDGSAGTVKEWTWIPQSTSNQAYHKPVIDAGYWSTTVSTGIYIGSTLEFLINIHYVEYVP